jgi:hypothetical protein
MRTFHILMSGLIVMGCSTVQLRRSQIHLEGGLVLVLDEASFDGQSMKGRLLVGSSEGQRQMDLSIWPFQGMNLRSAQKCESLNELPLYARDGGRLAPKDKASSSISLSPGDWYGRNVDLLVSPEQVVSCVILDAMLPTNAAGQPGTEIVFSIRAQRGGEVALIQSKRPGPKP